MNALHLSPPPFPKSLLIPSIRLNLGADGGVGVGVSSQSLLLLEQLHVMAATEQVGGGQAGDAAAHDRDPFPHGVPSEREDSAFSRKHKGGAIQGGTGSSRHGSHDTTARRGPQAP